MTWLIPVAIHAIFWLQRCYCPTVPISPKVARLIFKKSEGAVRFSYLAAVVAVAGCASQIMSEMVGKDISQVVAQYGPPVNVYDLPDGRRAFQWRMDSAIVMPMTTNYNVYGYGNYATGSATTTGGYLGNQVCFYTLYTVGEGGNRWTVVGFEPPRAACE